MAVSDAKCVLLKELNTVEQLEWKGKWVEMPS